MGTKGIRKGLKKSDKYQEPDLLVSVNDILKRLKSQDYILIMLLELKI